MADADYEGLHEVRGRFVRCVNAPRCRPDDHATTEPPNVDFYAPIVQTTLKVHQPERWQTGPTSSLTAETDVL